MLNAYRLHYGKSTKALAEVTPDSEYAGMWRIRWPDGQLSDMVNLSRAKDAAMVLVRKNGIIDQSTNIRRCIGNVPPSPQEPPPVESTEQAGREVAGQANTHPEGSCCSSTKQQENN
jgi:hypothetical protein